MLRKLIIAYAIAIVILILVVSCAAPKLTPAPVLEQEIPVNFTNYTSEGLFSISYPQDWTPVTSLMAEIEEETKEWITSIDPEAEVEESRILFMAGMPDEEGYYPSVGISVTPRCIGYYTLDEIVESEDLWSREHLQNYYVHSQVRTSIDGREADISISKDYDPEYGVWQYTTLTMVKDDFAWFVTCSSEAADFTDYEDIFNSVVKSIRLLN